MNTKGNVDDVSSEPLFLQWHVRFTAVLNKPLSDQGWITRTSHPFVKINST